MAKYRLPQHDNDSDRAHDLDKWKRDFRFDFKRGYPIAERYPLTNMPGPEYQVKVTQAALGRRSSLKAILEKSGLRFAKGLSHISTLDLANILIKQDISPIIDFFMSDMGTVLPRGRPTSRQDYAAIFQKDVLPESEKNFDSDAAFANTYLAGSDPDMLRRMQVIPGNFPITTEQLRTIPALAHDDLPTAIREQRIYYVDYAMMQNLENGQHPQQSKYMYAPLAAFAVSKNGGPMVPFAIQTGQNPEGRIIYTPADNWSWKIARSTVLAATNAHSAIISHLSLTHLLMDPIALCFYRNLSSQHPVYALMHRHFSNTLVINNAAFQSLVGHGQFVDRMLGSTMNSNYKLIADARRAFDFKANYLPTKLRAKQTDNTKALPVYPYRDDGLLIWNEILAWVTNYIRYYYASENELQADGEIQSWAREVGSESIGQVKGFATGNGFSSLQELIETLTMIIFTAGPQHAIVNFSQRTDLAYVPSAPMAGYIPEIVGKGHTEQDWLNFLPPLDVAVVQMTLCNMLGGVYYGRLGDYGSQFSDSNVLKLLALYNSKLAALEQIFEERNRSRAPFVHFLPSRIPQSINI